MHSHTSDKTIKSTDLTIKMKSGSTFSIPGSWERETSEDYIQMTTPEHDLSAYFIELPETQSLESLTKEAWKKIQPDFNLQSTQTSSPPTSDNWERMCQVVYDVPSSESRIVVAIVRTFEGQAYVCLVDGKIAGLSRRTSELMLMSESWKPIGFKETQLNNNAIKEWTEIEIQSFEKFISDSMQKLEIPGAAIAIIRKDGKSIYSKGFGVKEIGSNDPVTTDTLFMIGSITKSLTTLLAAMRVNQKKLSWETLITDILKNFSVADVELTKKLTIRQTFSASTGMPSGGLESFFKFSKPEDRILEMKEMKPTTGVGEIFQYSN